MRRYQNKMAEAGLGLPLFAHVREQIWIRGLNPMPPFKKTGQTAHHTSARDVHPTHIVAVAVKRYAHRDLEVRTAPFRTRAVATLSVSVWITFVISFNSAGAEEELRVTGAAEPSCFLVLVID